MSTNRFRNISLHLLFVCASAFLFWPQALHGQTGLSTNSGINSSDTYAVMDLTVQDQRTFTPPASSYTSPPSPLPVKSFSHGAKHFHVEMGFDTSDNFVANITPTDAATDPTQTQYVNVGSIHIRGDRMFLYDTAGNPIPIVLPNGYGIPNILTQFGGHPFSSILGGLVSQNISTTASLMRSEIVSQNGSQAILHSTYNNNSPNYSAQYVLSGSHWVLSSKTISGSTGNGTWSTTTNISNLVWNDNTTGDNRRASTPSTLSYGASAPLPTLNVAMPTIPSVPNTSSQQSGGGSVGNVIFQHGFISSGQTWNRMTNWLQSDFSFNSILTPSIGNGGTDSLSNWVPELQSAASATGLQGWTAIGHSAGGLVSRNAAQLNSNLIRSVITVDSPQHGAFLLTNSEGYLFYGLDDLFSNFLLDSCSIDSASCDFAYAAGNVAIPALAEFGLSESVPATTDLAYGSAYTSNLNSVTESFPRYGIVGLSDQRWLLFRFVGDLLCNPDDACGGRALAQYANVVYYALYSEGILDEVLSDYYYDQGDDYDSEYYEYLSIEAFSAVSDMDNIDDFWDLMVDQNTLTGTIDPTSDGVVQGSSQYYPNGAPNYVIHDADTHVGATKSNLDRAALDYILNQQEFSAQAACSFSLSPNATAYQYQGGQLTISVTTSSSCNWSAVSNAPWIEVYNPFSATLPNTGSGSGSADFTIDINTSQDPRSGTITIGGSTVTIVQTGVSGNIGSGWVTVWEAGIFNTGPTPLIVCAPISPNCYKPPPPKYETVTITINGTPYSVTLASNADPTLPQLVNSLANAINSDPNAVVVAGVAGPTVYLVTKNTTGANYSLSVTPVYSPPYYRCIGCVGPPAYALQASGASLIGSN